LQFGSSFADYLLKGRTDDFVYIAPSSNNSFSTTLSNIHFSNSYFKVVKNSIEIYALPSFPKDLEFNVDIKGMVNPLFELYFKDVQKSQSESNYDQINKSFDDLGYSNSYSEGKLI
jgi:hypothetical protein